MNRLRGVVVGAGYFSRFHLDAWNRIDEVEIVALCDLDTDAANRAAERFGVPIVYTDYAAMLDAETPDFVDIITRPDSHLALVEEAARRGIPIICQKPLAPTTDDARELVGIAESAGVPLMVHENFRFQPWYREIRRLLDRHAIGERLHLLSFRCRLGDGWSTDAYLDRQPYFRTMPRLLIFETGVHFVDTFRYLAGEIDGVYASLRRLNPEIAGEDCATVLFEFQAGARGTWDGNRYNEPNAVNPRYTFGELLVEGDGGSIRLYADGRLTVQTLGDAERDHEYAHRDDGFAGDCVLATQRHFVDALRTGSPFETGGRDYLRTLAVVDAIYESAATGQPVRGLVNGDDCDANR